MCQIEPSWEFLFSRHTPWPRRTSIWARGAALKIIRAELVLALVLRHNAGKRARRAHTSRELSELRELRELIGEMVFFPISSCMPCMLCVDIDMHAMYTVLMGSVTMQIHGSFIRVAGNRLLFHGTRFLHLFAVRLAHLSGENAAPSIAP